MTESEWNRERAIAALNAERSKAQRDCEILERNYRRVQAALSTAQAEVDRLTAALEVERAWWECLEQFGIFHLTREARDQRLGALTAALEEQP